MKIKENIFKNFILTGTAELYGFISNFIIIYLLSQMFPPNEFVLYPFSTAFLLFFLIFANFGLNTAIIQKLSTSKEEKREKVVKLISEGFKWVFLFTIIASLVLYFMSDLFEAIYKLPNLGIILKYTALYLFTLNLIYFFESIFQGLWNFKVYSLSNVTLNSLKLIVIFINFIIKFPIYIIIALFSFIALIQFIIILVYIQTKYKIISNIFKFDKEMTKTLLKFSLFVFLPTLFMYLINNFNQFILAYYITPVELAYFFIVFMIMQVLYMPVFIFIRLILPYASYYTQKKGGDRKGVFLIYNSIFKYGLLIVIPVSFYVLYFSDYLIFLIFGKDYFPASNYLKVYIFYLSIKLLSVAGEYFLLASDEAKLVFKITAITTLFTIILSILLIPHYFINGAIISIIIPHSVSTLSSIYLVKIKNQFKFDLRVISLIIKYIISSIISLIFIFLVNFLFNLRIISIITLFFFSGIYFGIFFILILLTKAFSIIDIRELIKYLKT